MSVVPAETAILHFVRRPGIEASRAYRIVQTASVRVRPATVPRRQRASSRQVASYLRAPRPNSLHASCVNIRSIQRCDGELLSDNFCALWVAQIEVHDRIRAFTKRVTQQSGDSVASRNAADERSPDASCSERRHAARIGPGRQEMPIRCSMLRAVRWRLRGPQERCGRRAWESADSHCAEVPKA